MLINKRPKIFWITYSNCLPFKCEIQDKPFFAKCKIKRAKKYEQFSLSYVQNLRTMFIALAMHLLHVDPISTCFLEGRVTASLNLALLVWSSGFKWPKMTTGHSATAHSPALVIFSGKTGESWWWLQLSGAGLHPAHLITQLSVLCSASIAPYFLIGIYSSS